MRTHAELDKRSLAMHCLVAERVRRDPALFERAQLTLARWRSTVCAASQPYLDEWDALMSQGAEVCLRVATEDSERATALRQSSPFAGLLTHQERFAFLKSWGSNHAP
jgi:hypothetical protein